MADALTEGDRRRRRRRERARTVTSGRVMHERDTLTLLPSYRLSMDELGVGASLGNGHCWVTMRGNGAIDRVFSTDLGKTICGSILFTFSGLGTRLVLDGEHELPSGPGAFVRLRPEEGGQATLHAAYQRWNFQLPGDMDVQQTIFVPKIAPRARSHQPKHEPPVVYALLSITNHSDEPRRPRIQSFANLRGDTDPDIKATYDAKRHALIARNAGTPQWVRVFGATVPVTSYGTTTNASQVYSVSHVQPLTNALDCSGGHVLGGLQVDLDLRPGETQEFAFVLAFSHEGDQQALRCFDGARDAQAALDETIAFYQEAVQPAEVLTPDAVINEGAVWAKINMLRVSAEYPTGQAFTNDPSRSSAVVARDSFWFVYGCDYLREEYSCSLLEAFATRQQPTGKIIEFYDAITGETADYDLNINDNTPLFILAVNHHWRSCAHRECLASHYPAVVKAARYILSQRNEQGLVWCTATGESLHGIVGWRNIIPNYRISGAVTEVNAECAAALRAAGHLAENLGLQDDAEEFRRGAQSLTQAINTHLLNLEHGVYYLNIDVDGMVRTDLTADEVFPVIFRVAPEDVAFRIVSRLNMPDFLTDAGLRTVSSDSPDFDPTDHWGLLGGVWPGMTWWYAFAAARYHPGEMVQALRSSFAHYAHDPRQHNTVPGHFSEWFDGESLVNRGMRLSPWEAPRFLWAAVEGICGVMLRPPPLPPMIQPLLPLEWKWVGLRQLAYHSRPLSYFAARLGAPGPGAQQAAEQETADTTLIRLYANQSVDLQEGHTVEVFDRDISDLVEVLNVAVRVVALARPGEQVICLGNTAEHSIVCPLGLDKVVDTSRHYEVQLYNSERGLWTRNMSDVQTLLRVAMTIESRGFRVLRLREV